MKKQLLFTTIAVLAIGAYSTYQITRDPELSCDTIPQPKQAEVDNVSSQLSAPGEIVVTRELKTLYQEIPPNQWDIADLWYKVQVCESIKKDKELDSYAKKREALDMAINKLPAERAEEEKRRLAFQACKERKVAELRARKEWRVAEEGARASSPGWKGGKKKSGNTVCVTIHDHEELVSGPHVERSSCNSNRCKVKAAYKRGNQWCADMEAWSESKSFGAGGWVTARIRIEVQPKINISEITNECKAEAYP